MSTYWPWWLGAIALASIAVGHWLTSGRLLGVSGTFARVLEGPERGASRDDAKALAAMLAATRAEFGDEVAAQIEAAPPVPERKAPPMPKRTSWLANVLFLVAVLAGGALGALWRGAWHPRFDLGHQFSVLFGSGPMTWFWLLLGGAFVGFGTTMAGGCTSGHGLCGVSRVQPGSLLATASFFGIAIVFSIALGALRS